MAGVAVWTGSVKGEEDNREYNIAAMVILALETVTRAGSLALYSEGGPGPAMIGDSARTHGVRLPDELRRFAEANGQSIHSIDYFVAVTGPGSFTGLRIGLATVQGLALAGHRPTIGIPTLEAMASGHLDASSGIDAIVLTTLDAARGEVFYAAWDVAGGDTIEAADPILDARVGSPAQAAAELAARRGTRPVVLVGPGAERFAGDFAAALPDARREAAMPNLAAAAARLAARRLSSATPPHGLRPVYVRRPDAELARARAQARNASVPSDDLDVFEVTSTEDIAAVARLQERAFGHGWGEDALTAGLATVTGAKLYAARRTSGELVAYCACWQVVDELHIDSLAVDPPSRRRGIARALMGRVMRAAASAGATGATLEVRESNRAGRALYESLGFRVEGVRRGYYEHPREDALVLWHRDLTLW